MLLFAGAKPSSPHRVLSSKDFGVGWLGLDLRRKEGFVVIQGLQASLGFDTKSEFIYYKIYVSRVAIFAA